MQTKEVLVLLAMAATYDNKINAPTDEERLNKAKAWAAALDSDMTFAAGRELVIAHYAEHKTTLMPADLNKAWRARCAQLRKEEYQRQLMAELKPSAEAVGMPDYVREQLNELLKRAQP